MVEQLPHKESDVGSSPTGRNGDNKGILRSQTMYMFFSFAAPVGQPVDVQVAGLAGVQALSQRPGYESYSLESVNGFQLHRGESRDGMRQWSVHIPVRNPSEVRWAYEQIGRLAAPTYFITLTGSGPENYVAHFRKAPGNCYGHTGNAIYYGSNRSESIGESIEQMAMCLAVEAEELRSYERDAEVYRTLGLKDGEVLQLRELRRRIEQRERWMPRETRASLLGAS